MVVNVSDVKLLTSIELSEFSNLPNHFNFSNRLVYRWELKVLLIDTNIITFCKFNEVLVLPERFKEFPPQAVDVRISRVLPQDLDAKWDNKSTKCVKRWFKQYKNCSYIQSKIDLTLMDCIWVKSVEIIEKASSNTFEKMSLSIKDNLIESFAAVADSRPLQMLRGMAEAAGESFLLNTSDAS